MTHFLPIAMLAALSVLPWTKRFVVSASGFTDQEACYKLDYYAGKDIMNLKEICEKEDHGVFTSTMERPICAKSVGEFWDCYSRITTNCKAPRD